MAAHGKRKAVKGRLVLKDSDGHGKTNCLYNLGPLGYVPLPLARDQKIHGKCRTVNSTLIPSEETIKFYCWHELFCAMLSTFLGATCYTCECVASTRYNLVSTD